MQLSCACASCATSPAKRSRNFPTSASCAGAPTLTRGCRLSQLLSSRRTGGNESGVCPAGAEMKLPKIVKACRVDKAGRFRLADCDPAETFGLAVDKDHVEVMLADGLARLTEMQQRLYAQDRWS